MVSTAPSHGRADGAIMARSRSRWVVGMDGGFERRLHLREGEPLAGPDADRLRTLHARDAGRQFRRRQSVVGRRARRADGGYNGSTSTARRGSNRPPGVPLGCALMQSPAR